jgi:membrane protein YdbS with pleckstrin-like domain
MQRIFRAGRPSGFVRAALITVLPVVLCAFGAVPTAGWVFDTQRSDDWVWFACAALIVVAAILSLRIRREEVPGFSAIDRPPLFPVD